MSAPRRAFVVVMDACGVGALPDAAEYGDPGADTLAHVAQDVGGLDVPHLASLGLGAISDIEGVAATTETPGAHGRLHPLGPGKDSTTGHWELMGCVPPAPLPTYPGGFPETVMLALSMTTKWEFCANKPANGLAVLDEFGEHHLANRELIAYTSADSVLQIAGHHDVISEKGLHEVCRKARQVMSGDHAVGRVIARPFTGPPGAFVRTTGRKDFSLEPPRTTAIDVLAEREIAVHAVGKTNDLFAGRNISAYHAGATNADALHHTTELLDGLDGPALVFTNLVETDQLFGHRKDVQGFKAAIEAIDATVGRWLPGLREGDLLVLTADHGCDPRMPHSDHTREHVPLLATWDGARAVRHDGPLADVGQTVLSWLTGSTDDRLPGTSFA